jgi:hypothetical protein
MATVNEHDESVAVATIMDLRRARNHITEAINMLAYATRSVSGVEGLRDRHGAIVSMSEDLEEVKKAAQLLADGITVQIEEDKSDEWLLDHDDEEDSGYGCFV